MATLILVRHGESQMNVDRLLAGISDTPLTALGKQQARQAAKKISGVKVGSVYTSELKRAKDTYTEIRITIGVNVVPTTSVLLNERDYGTYTGVSKDEVMNELGEVGYEAMKNEWNFTPDGGESLSMLHKRVVPYYVDVIKKDLLNNKNVLVVSHHNVLRVLIRYITGQPESAMQYIKLKNAEVHIMDIPVTRSSDR